MVQYWSSSSFRSSTSQCVHTIDLLTAVQREKKKKKQKQTFTDKIIESVYRMCLCEQVLFLNSKPSSLLLNLKLSTLSLNGKILRSKVTALDASSALHVEYGGLNQDRVCHFFANDSIGQQWQSHGSQAYWTDWVRYAWWHKSHWEDEQAQNKRKNKQDFYITNHPWSHPYVLLVK